MTKSSIERRLRALETDRPKPTLGTLPDPLTGEQVPEDELFKILSEDELLRLEEIVMADIDEGPGLRPRAVAFLAVAFERRRMRKEVR